MMDDPSPKCRRSWRRLLSIPFPAILLALALPAAGQADPTALAGKTIHFCGDGAGWPPFTYFKREGGRKTRDVVGYDRDVLEEILTPLGIGLQLHMPPWNRCLFSVEQGKRYQVALSSSFNEDRNRTFLLTRSYYQTRMHYFFHRKKFPDGLTIRDGRELIEHGRLCGLHGYNYEGVVSRFGLTNKHVEMGAKNFPALKEKTLKGRCALFLARYEIFAGFSRIGMDLLEDGALGHAPVPEAAPDAFHMLISRNYEHAETLKRILDEGFARLEKSGRLQALLERYLRSGR